jgi:hypothetical protein
VTVLCLVELDASGATDASLRALSFARSLASVAGLGPAGAGPSLPAGPPTSASPAGPPTPASPAGPPTPASPAGPPTPASPPGPGGGGLAAVLFGEATDVPGEVLAAYGVSGV